MVRTVAAVVLMLIVECSPSNAASHKKKPASAAAFDYYMLTLSYAPDFCAQPTGNKDPRECGAGRHIGSPSRHADMRQMCFEDVEPAVPAQHGTEPAATAGTQFAMSRGS